MKIAVVGSRSFNDYQKLCSVLGPLCPKGTVIVSGGARGADALAERYADEHGFDLEVYLANWKEHGRAAGMIRNKQIVDASDMVVAFWDSESRGTQNTIARARAAGKTLYVEMF